MIDRINLTADEAREFNDTGRVEIWTELDPQPRKKPFRYYCPIAAQLKIVTINPDMGWWFPYGPDGERWVAEPWARVEINILDRGEEGDCEVELVDSELYIESNVFFTYEADNYYKNFDEWQTAESMPREASRANAMIDTDLEQRDEKWWFKTTVLKEK